MRKLAAIGAATLVLAASVVQASAYPTLNQILGLSKNVPAYSGGFEGYRAEAPVRGLSEQPWTGAPSYNVNPNTRYFGR